MNVTGIILAGGKNLRLGRKKPLEKVGGVPLIERVVNRLQPLTTQLIIVTSKDTRGLPSFSGAEFVEDIYPGGGPLGGIYTGLNASKNETNILVACDMPFLKTDLLRYLLSLSSGYDAIVPSSSSGMEPLHAIYKRVCAPAIKQKLDEKERTITSFFKEVKVHYVKDKECRRYDPELLSFFNINRPADLELANKLAAKSSEFLNRQ